MPRRLGERRRIAGHRRRAVLAHHGLPVGHLERHAAPAVRAAQREGKAVKHWGDQKKTQFDPPRQGNHGRLSPSPFREMMRFPYASTALPEVRLADASVA